MTRLTDSARSHRLPAFFCRLCCPARGQPFPPERRNCSRTFRGVLQFRLPSAPQRYNTLDFPAGKSCANRDATRPYWKPRAKVILPFGYPSSSLSANQTGSGLLRFSYLTFCVLCSKFANIYTTTYTYYFSIIECKSSGQRVSISRPTITSSTTPEFIASTKRQRYDFP